LLAGDSSAQFAVVACVRTTVEQDPNGTGITAIPRSVMPMREAVLRLQELPKSLTAAFRDFANNIQPVGTRIAQMFSALFDVVAQPERRNSNSPKRTEEVNQHMTDKPKKKPRGFAVSTPGEVAHIDRLRDFPYSWFRGWVRKSRLLLPLRSGNLVPGCTSG
jgi:hypothetical protein